MSKLTRSPTFPVYKQQVKLQFEVMSGTFFERIRQSVSANLPTLIHVTKTYKHVRCSQLTS